jgi:hypothetical protein
MTKKPPPAPPVTRKQLEHIASEAMTRPSTLTTTEIKSLGGAVLRRIEPRDGKAR